MWVEDTGCKIQVGKWEDKGHVESFFLVVNILTVQAMEDRLLQNQETRFKEIIAQFSLLPGYRGSKNPEQDLDPSSLEKNMLQLSEKIDFLMSGENETNKVIMCHQA